MQPRPLIDPGWLFLAAGIAILAATILIPASEDLARARWQRDRALAVEAHRIDRLTRYEEYLAAVESGEPSLVLSLAEKQLNQIPADRAAIPGGTNLLGKGVSVFPSLEPPPLKLAEFRPSNSILSRWTRGGQPRLWLLIGGAISVLIGLLPASRGRVDVHHEPPPTPA
ncbi:hypothetical protein PHYC_03437 [Phycisphaerales bacterium]|nr:hypothetical protein PHYC_03437 [Phycisphaerales bacterium]